MYRKFKKVVLGLLVHLTPLIFFSKILRSEALVYKSYFFRRAVLRKLLDIRFSYKLCNFSRVCLLVKMASKTVTRSIYKLFEWSFLKLFEWGFLKFGDRPGNSVNFSSVFPVTLNQPNCTCSYLTLITKLHWVIAFGVQDTEWLESLVSIVRTRMLGNWVN